MKNVFVLTLVSFALLAPAVGAQERGAEFKLTGEAAGAVIKQAVSVPDANLPMIKGAAIIVEAGPNSNSSRRVTVAVSAPVGQYVARGFIGGVDAPIPLGVWDFGVAFGGSPGILPGVAFTILNGDPAQIFPGMGPLWKVDVIHLSGGSIEKLSAWSSGNTLGGVNFTVGAEAIVNSLYSLTIGGKLSPNASVALGQGAVANLTLLPFGSVVAAVPLGSISSASGTIAVAVCTAFNPDGTDGWCGTDIHRPKNFIVPMNGGSNADPSTNPGGTGSGAGSGSGNGSPTSPTGGGGGQGE